MGLAVESQLVHTGWAISFLLYVNELRKYSGPLFLVMKLFCLAYNIIGGHSLSYFSLHYIRTWLVPVKWWMKIQQMLQVPQNCRRR